MEDVVVFEEILLINIENYRNVIERWYCVIFIVFKIFFYRCGCRVRCDDVIKGKNLLNIVIESL